MAGKLQVNSRLGRIRSKFNRPPDHIPQVNTEKLTDVPDSGTNAAKLLTEKDVALDRLKAVAYIELPIFPGERPINDTNVQSLLDEMLGGTFNEDIVTLCTCLHDGIVYKINGQHTCWAYLYAIDKKPNLKYNVRELHYEAKTPEQLKQLYASFDRGMSRTDSHLTRVYLTGTAVVDGLPKEMIGKAAMAIKFWLYPKKWDRDRAGPQEVSLLVQKEHPDLFRRVVTFLAKHKLEKFIHRHPVIASIFATFAKVPTKAEDFWVPVVTGVGMDHTEDPRLVLRNHLQSSVLRADGGAAKKSEGQETQYRTCIHMWNQWRAGKRVKVLRLPRDEKRFGPA
jgi:hypothetical protein